MSTDFESALVDAFFSRYRPELLAVETVEIDRPVRSLRRPSVRWENRIDHPALTDAFQEVLASELARIPATEVSLVRDKSQQLYVALDFSREPEHPLAFLVEDVSRPYYIEVKVGCNAEGDFSVAFHEVGLINLVFPLDLDAVPEDVVDAARCIVEGVGDPDWLADEGSRLNELVLSEMLGDVAVVMLREKVLQMLVTTHLLVPSYSLVVPEIV